MNTLNFLLPYILEMRPKIVYHIEKLPIQSCLFLQESAENNYSSKISICPGFYVRLFYCDHTSILFKTFYIVLFSA